MNLDEIIVAIKDGDRGAFKQLYDHYAPLFKGIAYRYIGDSSRCNDVLQEAFIKIFKNIQSYTGSGNFEGWMKRIVVNCCLDYIKKEKKLNYEDEEVVVNHTSDVASALSSLTVEEIIKVVDRLPKGYRTVFNLSVIEGYDHGEISEMLGISKSASRSQLSKAKQLLQKELKGLQIFNQVA